MRRTETPNFFLYFDILQLKQLPIIQFLKQSDMGQNQTKKEPEGQQVQHERLGTVKLELKPQDPREEEEEEAYLMHLKRSVENERVYNEWVKNLIHINDSQSKDVILLPLKHSFESVGMCGSSGLVKLTYDYYEFVLRTEVENRYKLKKDFLETEVWYLLYNIVRAGSKCEHLKKKIGNVHPQNILINESGQIKIISTVSLPGEVSNYDFLIEHPIDNINQRAPVFLAPEEINNDLIQKGTYPSHVDPSLAEVFSIGLTILSSGTLQTCDDVYKTSPYELRKDKLNSLLRIFKEKYSDYLFQTVASMLSLNPQERRRCSQIASSLNQYEQYILDLEPFQPPRQSQQHSQPQFRNTVGYPAQHSYPNQPQPVPQHPQYYQGQGQPTRGTYQQGPISYGQPVQPTYNYRPQGIVQHQGPM